MIKGDLGETKEILVFNKSDLLPPGEAAALAERYGAVAVSALERTGLRALLERRHRAVRRPRGQPAPAASAHPVAPGARPVGQRSRDRPNV